MFKSLTIRNFQSHKRTEIKFSPNITVIQGLSTTGKTAILRALNWLIYNRPMGDSFRSHFAKESTSVILYTDRFSIGRVKDGLKNTYFLGNPVEEWSGFGKQVPDKIQQVLNISELNIQNQLDTPFLITSSAGEISKTINRITKADKADEAITSLTRQVNQTNNQITNKKQDIKDAKVKLRTYSVLPDISKKLKQRDKLIDQWQAIDDVQEEIKTFESYQVWLDMVANNVKIYNQVLSKISKVEELQRQVDQIEDRIDDIEGIHPLRKAYIAAKNSYTEAIDDYLDMLQQEKICPICSQDIDQKTIIQIEREL